MTPEQAAQRLDRLGMVVAILNDEDKRACQQGADALRSHDALVAALRVLADAHHGYHLGMGPCVCDAHKQARAALALVEQADASL